MNEPIKAGVVLVDLQEGLIAGVRTRSAASLRRTTALLANFAQALGLPVHASVVPSPQEPPAPLLTELTSAEALAPKPRTSAGVTIGSLGWESDRRTMLLAGIAAEVAIHQTALAAVAAGFEVIVVLDATAGLHEETSAAALADLQRVGVRVLGLASVVAMLVTDFASPAGGLAFGVLRQLAGFDAPAPEAARDR